MNISFRERKNKKENKRSKLTREVTRWSLIITSELESNEIQIMRVTIIKFRGRE